MVPRIGRWRLRRLLRTFPAAAVLGPRQCGKTTLVRSLFPKAVLFDLERPSDLQRLEADPEYTLRHVKTPVILDEAQRLPALFPLLRALIDERRTEKGRFVLLGSAHFSLTQGISESLAGRIGFLDLDPFAYIEVAGAGASLADLWLRGGFPDPCLTSNRRARRDWMDAYLRTFLERDLAGLAIEGYRPGKRTADYLEKVIMRITYVGAAFLAIVAIIPSLISSALEVNYTVASFYGGTGLLIVISVALDLVQKINSHLVMRNYPGLTED